MREGILWRHFFQQIYNIKWLRTEVASPSLFFTKKQATPIWMRCHMTTSPHLVYSYCLKILHIFMFFITLI